MKKFYFLLILLGLSTWGWGQATLPVATTTMDRDALPTGFTHFGLGSNYTGPHLKFDTQDDYLVLYLSGTPGTLTFELGVNNTFPGTIPSTATFSVEESANGSSYTNVASYTNVGGGLKTVTTLNSTTRYIRWIYTTKPSGTNISFRNVNLAAASSTPTITLSKTELTGFTYVQGSGPSTEQSFSISGSDLTDDISIDAPANYEISTGTGVSFSATDPIVLTETDGTAASTTIYVRLKAGLAAGSYNSQTITATSTYATYKTVTCSGSVTAPPDPEPTNHVTGFSATAASGSQINLSWSDNDGAQAAGGFLIVGKTGAGTFYEPVDGTDPSDDTDWSDNNFEFKVAHGVQSYSVIGLTSSTQYDFKIYPYTNSGVNIDYKTDGIVPTADATTSSAPVVIAGWDFDPLTGGTDNFGPSPFTPTSSNSNAIIGGLTRGSGVAVTGAAAGNAWGGAAWETSASSATAITNNEFVTFTVTANANYLVSLSSISAYNIRRSSTGPATGLWQYQINGGSFVGIGSEITWGVNTTSAGNAQSAIDLSGISALQNIPNGTVVTFRIVNYNSSGTGTWYLNDPAGTPGDDFIVNGYVKSNITIYTGTGNWTATDNWSNGLPASASNVTINGTVTVDGTVMCNNLTISTSGAVTVTAGQGLAVNGDLLIQSSDAGTGSFIGAADDYTITGSTTLQRYLTNYSTGGDNKYHLLSSPVSTQPIQPEFVANSPAADVDFYKFDEPTATWINTKTEANAWNAGFESNFVVGRGYLVAYPNTPVTKSFTGGTLNSYSSGTPLVITCTNTNAGGWNLIGNPFPSAIDWDLVQVDGLGDGMDAALYYYDHDAANYRYYVQLESIGSLGSGSRYIPAMQGFMVHAKTSGTKTVSLHNGHRVHSTQAFYKSQNEINNLLTVKLQANGKTDEAYILYFDEATESFDGKFDAYKLFSYAEGMPQLYTISADEAMLAINTLPTQSDSKAVALGYKAANAGTHSMSFEGLTSFAQPGSLQLEDKLLGIMHTLNDGSYEFVSEAGTVNDRFVLHFGAVGISEQPASATLKAYVVGAQLFFPLQGEATLEIVDLQGRVLQQSKVSGQGLASQPLQLPSGVYVVRLTSGQSAQTAKVIVK